MNRTITSFRKGFTNGGGYPYITALLDCGHAASVQMKPSRGHCVGCGKELIATRYDGCSFDPCECGRWSCTITFSPEQHNDADRVSQIGDAKDCKACDQYQESLAALRALTTPILHARFDNRSKCYRLYRREPTSPSGKMLEMSVDATPEVEKILDQKRISMISPTEFLHSDVAR